MIAWAPRPWSLRLGGGEALEASRRLPGPVPRLLYVAFRWDLRQCVGFARCRGSDNRPWLGLLSGTLGLDGDPRCRRRLRRRSHPSNRLSIRRFLRRTRADDELVAESSAERLPRARVKGCLAQRAKAVRQALHLATRPEDRDPSHAKRRRAPLFAGRWRAQLASSASEAIDAGTI